jgi:prepilin-type N-terminal cleavage/methylation domain-containing protein
MWKRHSLETGFTLLEVVVAVTLVAVIAVGMWALFSISLRSWSRGTAFIETNQHHRSILDLVRKQMTSIYPLWTPQDLSQPGMIYPIFTGTESSLQFISLSSLQFQESPGLTYVSYDVSQDSTGGYSLIERETRYTGQLPDEATMESSRTTPIFENLDGCAFEYFYMDNPSSNTATLQRVSEWDSQQQMRLPMGVSISMKFHDPQGNQLDRLIVAPISAEAVDPRNPNSIFGRVAR